MKFKKTLASLVLSVACLFGGSTEAGTLLYDNFSSETLNTQRWEERLTARTSPAVSIDEHYLDTINQNYHTAQLSQASNGGGIELKSLQNLQAGDILEFDVNYVSGNGNHWSAIFWDDSSNWSHGISAIGHWNEVDSHGGEFGSYHFKGVYGDDKLDFELTTPIGSIQTYTYYTNVIDPYTFSIVTKTGHNGTCHFDYDNFTISQIPEPSTLSLLAIGSLVGAGAYALRRRKNLNNSIST